MVCSLSKYQLLTSKRGSVISLSSNSDIFSFEEQLFAAAPMEWGRKELPPLNVRSGSTSFDTINGESMKCVINGHVHPRDTVEIIQYASQFGGATIYCQGVSTADVAIVLRDPENFPVSFVQLLMKSLLKVQELLGPGTYKRGGQWQGKMEKFLMRVEREGYSWSIMIQSSGETCYASKEWPNHAVYNEVLTFKSET